MNAGRSEAATLEPAELDRVRDAVYDSAAVEAATASDGRPQTFPLTPFYDADREAVVVTSPPAFAGKVEAAWEHPQVSMLFYDVDEPFELRGRASVRDDDLEANAQYVRSLAEAEPASGKQEGFSKTTAMLESRIGRFLFGWYALRVVLEVEPVAIEPLAGDCGSLPPWPERGVGDAEAASYDRLSVTAVDDDGWPVTRSVRDVEPSGETAYVDADLPIEDGRPACLLCHWHTDDLQDLGQRLFRGRARPADGGRGGLSFRPASSFSMRNETRLDLLKFVIQGKRRTRAYFRD